MKLLLTSNGLCNQTITNALLGLVGKKPQDITVVFIPTAANLVVGDKDWAENDLNNVKKQNFKSVDVVDIATIEKAQWLPKLEKANVILFEGGQTYYLMDWLNKSGLKDILPELLKDKVYVGISAGSMVTNPELNLEIHQIIYEDEFDKNFSMPGLNFVNFYFLPHLNSSFFKQCNEKNVKKLADKISNKIYAMDDQTAIKINDDKLEIVGEGKWLEIN